MKTIEFFIFIILIINISITGYSADLSNLSKDKTLVVGFASSILSLDPTNHRDRDTQMVLKNIFDSLTTRNKHLLVVPQLAESWYTTNPTTWEFKLRKGIKFHNGDEFSAKDVKFTLDRVTKDGRLDGKTSPRKSLLGRIVEVKIMDKYTIHILTDKPWPILPLMLTLQEIVPSNYMQRVGSTKFETSPIGTGPFQFVLKQKDGSLILKKFDSYYGGSPEKPPVQTAKITRLIFKTVAHPALRIAMLKKGELDIITNVSHEAIPLLDVLPNISVMGQPSTRSYFAELNCAKFPFNDVRSRVALNYALDMRMIINTIFQNRAQILPTILLKKAFAFNDQIVPYPYDPEQAKELLQQAKFPKNYIIKIFSIEKYGKFANNISLFLAKIGIKSKITIGKKTAVRAAMKNQKADILVTSWGNTTLDPVGILFSKLKSNGRGNFSGYVNKKVDELLLLAESTLNSKMRKEAYKEIQKIIYKEAPMIFGYASEEFYGVKKHVKEFYPSATGMLDLHDVYLLPKE